MQKNKKINKISIITLVNDEFNYNRLKNSFLLHNEIVYLDFIPIDADGNNLNAATALNNGLSKSDAEWAILVHQDVIIPGGWLNIVLDELYNIDKEIIILGLVGVRENGSFVGHIKDPHGHFYWGSLPSQVISVDEHLIIVRKSAGVIFDENNPGFHCYGTDICLEARKKGFRSIVIDAPVLHLSGGNIDSSFITAADWLLNKWGKELNYIIPTCADLIYRIKFTNIHKLAFYKIKRRITSMKLFSTCNCKNIN